MDQPRRGQFLFLSLPLLLGCLLFLAPGIEFRSCISIRFPEQPLGCFQAHEKETCFVLTFEPPTTKEGI